jgi:succinyl-diaminopimelate desuccinylase
VLAELSQLLAVDTSFPPGTGYEAFADLVEALTRPLGFRAERVGVPQNLWDPGDGSAAGERVT